MCAHGAVICRLAGLGAERVQRSPGWVRGHVRFRSRIGAIEVGAPAVIDFPLPAPAFRAIDSG